MRKKKTVLTPKMNSKIRVTILTDGNASVAHAQFYGFTRDRVLIFETTGSAKREQGDPRDQVIAVELAVGRALMKMAHRMVRDGTRRVQVATAEQEDLKGRRHRRNGKSRDRVRTGKLLAINVIRDTYGEEAAERAAARRAHSI